MHPALQACMHACQLPACMLALADSPSANVLLCNQDELQVVAKGEHNALCCSRFCQTLIVQLLQRLPRPACADPAGPKPGQIAGCSRGLHSTCLLTREADRTRQSHLHLGWSMQTAPGTALQGAKQGSASGRGCRGLGVRKPHQRTIPKTHRLSRCAGPAERPSRMPCAQPIARG